MRKRAGMALRVAAWAAAGYLVARGWGLYYASVFGTGEAAPVLEALALWTQPVIAADRFFDFLPQAVGVGGAARWNAAAYASLGAVVEAVLRRRRSTTDTHRRHTGTARSVDDRSPREAVVLFDGYCAFCSGSVRFVLDRDPRRLFAFAPLQSAVAEKLLRSRGASSDDTDSMILVDGERCFTRSTAALRIARKMSGLWPALYVLTLCPRPVRDRVYDAFARNRYRWFGRNDACYAPSREERERFLE